MKQWKAQWNGHPIRVEHDNAWGKGETRIFVDGIRAQQLARNSGNGVTNEPGHCESEFEDENGTHRITAEISYGLLREFCHIVIDGKVIGGDLERKLILPAASETQLSVPAQKKQLKRELFFRAVVAPLILIPLCDMIDMYFLNRDFSVLIFVVAILFVNVLQTLFKLFKVSRGHSTDKPKNSTPV